MGRNELIAEYMMKHLPKREMEAALIDPKSQPRKFVSSHLQVLRGKFASIVYTVDNQDYTDYFYFGEGLYHHVAIVLFDKRY